MNFPQKFNPFRGTRCAWIVPFIWALLVCATVTAPVTLEVFLHHRFGSRTGKSLLKGFLLLLLMAPLFKALFPVVPVSLFAGFMFAYVIAAICQWLDARFGGQNDHIHSYANGEPWPLWRQLPVAMTIVQRYLEPALCYLIAWTMMLLAPALAHWLFIATAALFIKEQVRRVQLRTHRLDALDSRVDTTERAPRMRAENEPFVEARPAPPIRRANPGPTGRG